MILFSICFVITYINKITKNGAGRFWDISNFSDLTLIHCEYDMIEILIFSYFIELPHFALYYVM